MSEWISVKKRLPEDGQDVFGFWPPSYSSGKKITGANFSVVKFRKDNSWWSLEVTDCDFCSPSHWMPLPEPPKKG